MHYRWKSRLSNDNNRGCALTRKYKFTTRNGNNEILLEKHVCAHSTAHVVILLSTQVISHNNMLKSQLQKHYLRNGTNSTTYIYIYCAFFQQFMFDILNSLKMYTLYIYSYVYINTKCWNYNILKKKLTQ